MRPRTGNNFILIGVLIYGLSAICCPLFCNLAHAGQLEFDGVPVDITTAANEDLVIAPGTGGNTQIGAGTGTNTNATSNDDLHITGILETDGAAYLNSATTLGDSTSDTITVTGYLGSHVIPATDSTYDLGSSSLAWRYIYVDIISGYNAALALNPASGYSLTGSVTKNAATGNEVAYDLAATINKATSGNYTGLKLNVTETSAPGADDRLVDLQVGGTSMFRVDNAGNVTAAGTITGTGGTDAPADAQYVTLAANATLTAERILTGTASQITVTDGGAGGNVTLSTPQDIATTSTPQFARLGLGQAADATNILDATSSSTTADSKALDVSHTGVVTGTGYAGYFSKTGASTTNVGLYATASGATNNYAAILNGGNVGIGTTTPTAVLHLKAGTATASTAPLKFTSGTLLTTAEAGAIEFLTDAYYGTITTGAARKTFAFTDSAITDFTGTLGVANGGTGATTFTTNGLLYGNTASPIQVTAQGGANTVLTANAGAPSFSASPTIGTSVTTPLVIGGTATTSDLNLQTTSGVGAAGADMHFLVGNNGATEAVTILNSGNVGIGTTVPGAKLDVNGTARFGTTGITTSLPIAVAMLSDNGSAGGDFQVQNGTYNPGLRIKNTAANGREYRFASDNTSFGAGGAGFDFYDGTLGDFMAVAKYDATNGVNWGFGRGFISPTATVHIKSYDAGAVPLIVSTIASPTVDIARFQINGTSQVIIDKNGNVGIGTTSPTALLHLKAGTATASTAPLKFTSGTLLTTAEAGAVEFLTDAYYGTITTGASRKTFAFTDSAITGFTGTLGVANGGTGATTFTTNGLLYGNTASPIQVTAQGGANTVLTANAGAPSFSASPTIGTSVTTPLVIGGTATTSDLNLKTTSGVGASGADMHFLVGNNGGTEAMTILNDGKVGIGTTGPGAGLQVGSGTPGSSPASSGIYVVGRSEFDATTYFGGGIDIGAAESAGIRWSDANFLSVLNGNGQTDTIFFNTPATDHTIIVGDIYNRAWDHSAQTNPTIFIHDITDPDVTNNKWGSLNHNGTGFVFSSGANTGAGTSPATIDNYIAFAPRGTERVRIDGTGNVGIGTTSPTAYLHLKAGTATANTAPLKFTSGTNLTTAEAGAFEWDGTSLYISQTSGPTRKTLAFTDAAITGFTGTLGVANGGTGATTFTTNGLLYGNTQNPIQVTAQGGANTVLTANAGAPSFSASPTIGTSVTTPLVIGGTATTSDLSLQTTSGVGASGADMHFLVGNNGATEAMTILNSGKVGIGTTSPSYKLDVVGTGTQAAEIKSTSGTATFIADAGESFSSELLLLENGSGRWTLYNHGATDTFRIYKWATTAGDAFMINSDGNVSIGSTTAPASLFVRRAAVSTTQAIGRFEAAVTGFTGTGLITENALAAASSFNLFEAATDSDGDEGGRATRFLIRGDGNVGIGTTTPTAYLHLKAGTATANTAPLKFTSGTNLTTAEAGAMEWDGTSLYISQTTGPTRKTLAYTDGSITGFTGTLAVANGGTGATTFTTNGLLYGNTQSAIQVTAQGGANTVLTANAGAPSFSASPTIGTSVTTPLVIGGTATTSDLSLQTTSGVGAAGADMHFLVGNNGATEAVTILNDGKVGIGTTAPTSRIHGDTTLSAATGDEVAYTLAYTTNKLTSGNDTGLVINQTDTASPGTSLLMDLQVGGTSRLKISNATTPVITTAGGLSISATGNFTANASTGTILNNTAKIGFATPSVLTDLVVLGAIDFGAGGDARLAIQGESGDYILLGNNTIIGGTATTSDLNLQTTSGVGASGADMHFLVGNNGATEAVTILNSGFVGIGTTSPTAVLHLKAGTATASTAPLKFTSGTLLTTAEAGAIEFLTDAYYGTITTGAARKTFAFTDSAITDFTGTLGVANGGTGATTFTTNGLLYGNTQSAIQVTAQGGANTVLTANAGAPSFSASPTIGTSVTTPLVIGGTATTADLSLQTTSGVGASGADMHFLVGNNGATEAVTILNSGFVGIGTTSPTAVLHLKAGTATASTAPLKFTSGTNLTTAEAGAMEWDGTSLYISQTTGPTRKTLAYTDAASTTASGIAELATTAEVNTGTDTGRVTTPVSIRDSNYAPKVYMVKILGSTTDHTASTSVAGDFRMPFAGTVIDVGAFVDTAGTTGVGTVDINESGTSILSTKITIDSTEKTSTTAATAPVISDSSYAADAIITYDIDGIQTTAAKGLTVWIQIIPDSL